MATVKIELKNGKTMLVEIDETNAPITAKNFLSYVDEGFYDGTIFHRVIPQFMIQGGGYTDDEPGIRDKKGAKPAIKGEFASNGILNPIKHKKGVISMARTSIKDSATSQFFICVADCPFLDGEYAAFGKLVDEESFLVAREISEVVTHSWGFYDDIPSEPIIIKSIKRV